MFLPVDNPESARWYEMKYCGVGGGIEVEAVLEQQDPVLELRLGNREGDVLFDLVLDRKVTKITTSLSEETVESGDLSLGGLEKVRVVVELQSEGVFVDLVGVGSVLLSYPPASWIENRNTAWDSVDTLSRIYIGGQNVNFTTLSQYFLE